MKSNESVSGGAIATATVAERLIDIATAHGVREGVNAGIRAAMEYLEQERQKARKSRYDRRLHNTRLLLKNYRLFKKHAEGAVFNAKKARESAIDILDGLDDTFLGDNAYVEGIKKSQQRTVIILRHIDEMLRYYRISCEQSGKPEDLRRYRVIMAMYIDPERLTPEEIGRREGIEQRTIYKDITTAVKPLSALIFGIDGMSID